MTKAEVQRWKDDTSGVASIPMPGTKGMPTRRRLWFMYEHIYAEFLGEARYLKPVAEGFARNLDQTLRTCYPATEWTAISVQAFCRSKVVEAAVNSLFGPDMLRLTPDLIERFWEFDRNVFKLVMGLPRWINAAPFQAHDRFVDAIRTWLVAAEASVVFPFGGGANICPGRRLAKAEIPTTVALVVPRFDIEFVGWTNPDGSPSERAAQSDLRFSGAGAMPPDRDMMLRWKSR